MSFNDTPIAGGDVVFKANTGQFKADMAQIEAVYGRTTGVMSDEAVKLALAQDKVNRAIARSGPASAAAARATLAYRAEIDGLAKSELAAAAASKKAADQRLAAYAGAAKNVGSTLTRFVTLPTALLTAAAVKLGIDFQQQMLLIQTQAGASATEVHKLSGEVLQLAHVAPQGPIELAKGLYHLESLGLRGATAMHTLRTSALAAGMGIADLESTASALGAVVVTGIKGAQNYDHAMGLLVGTVGAGNVRMEDLAGSIGNVAPAAAAAGVDLTSLGAAIATMTDRGFSADEASTRLRIALSLIQAPSEKAKKALKDMGVDAAKLGGLLRQPNGLLKVLETLHDAIDRVGKVRGNRDLLAGFGGGRSGLGIQTLVQSLDSTVSSYKQKLDQVDAQSKKFAANQKTYLHSEAYQLKVALSTIEADLTTAGGKIAPAIVGAAKAVSLLVDGFGKLPEAAKVGLGVIVGLLAVGGPVLLGIAAVIRAVQTIGNAFGRIPVQAGAAVAATDAELATLRASAAATAGELGVVGEAGAVGAGGLLGGIGGKLGKASLFAGGGLLAGSIAGSVIPGEAGQATSRALDLAGVGAGIGIFFGPEGAAAGAAIGGLVGGVSSLIHEGPSFTQQLTTMGRSIGSFGTLAKRARNDITALHSQIANDRVSRDQARQAVKAAQAEEHATRGTKAHAAAVDALRAAEANLGTATLNLHIHQQQLNQTQAAHTKLLANESKATKDFTAKLVELRTASSDAVAQAQRENEFQDRATKAAAVGAARLQTYIEKMQGLAAAMKSSNPQMARVIHNLIQIARDMNRIPNAKTIRIVVDETINRTFRGFDTGIGPHHTPAFFKSLRKAEAEANKPTIHHHRPPKFTTTIPTSLQLQVAQAQYHKNVPAEKKALAEEKAFLQRELQLAKTEKQRLAAIQALQSVQDQIDSLDQQTASSAKKRADNAKTAYQKKLDAEERRLQINLARAKLAETNAGDNKKALERALAAERKDLAAEVDFFRKEAHDKELALKQRQEYAKKEIAAEKARAEVNKKLEKVKGEAAKQNKDALKKAEAQFLQQLRDVFLTYAGNVFQPAATKPEVHVHQEFPAPPTDQHRQARYARQAMQAAFAS